jgi:dTDP-4-amino-4,6-dideoxygalactose transaminase
VRVSKYNYDAQLDGELENLVRDIANILTAGSYILSQPVEDFERRFADFLGVAHTVGTNSGTDALILGFMALGIGPGHRVITQANTFYATVAAIRLVGAVPVLVDAEENTFLIVPIHLQPAFADTGGRAGQFPVAERLAKELLAVPIRPDMTEDEVFYVVDVIRTFLQGSKPPTRHPLAL